MWEGRNTHLQQLLLSLLQFIGRKNKKTALIYITSFFLSLYIQKGRNHHLHQLLPSFIPSLLPLDRHRKEAYWKTALTVSTSLPSFYLSSDMQEGRKGHWSATASSFLPSFSPSFPSFFLQFIGESTWRWTYLHYFLHSIFPQTSRKKKDSSSTAPSSLTSLFPSFSSLEKAQEDRTYLHCFLHSIFPQTSRKKKGSSSTAPSFLTSLFPSFLQVCRKT